MSKYPSEFRDLDYLNKLRELITTHDNDFGTIAHLIIFDNKLIVELSNAIGYFEYINPTFQLTLAFGHSTFGRITNGRFQVYNSCMPHYHFDTPLLKVCI